MTSRDLARALGVSQSMISRAFSSQASIAPAMRMQIMDAAAAAGYRPNVVARSLSTRRSNIVGIVMAGMTNPFYPELLERLTRALQEVGLQTLLFHAPPGEDVDGQLPLLMQYQVDAVIIASAPISSGMAQTWLATGRPAILFNRSVPGTDVTTVACDNVAGGAAVADLFARLGRKRIGFVGGRADTSTNADRERGFTDRLNALGLPLHAHTAGTDYGYEQGYAATLRIAPSKPDAIFYANDITALGGMDALRQELRLRVPEDVAVVGFDDIPMAAWPAYRLTTLRQPVEAMIAATVSYLTAHMESAAPPEIHVLPGQLIERASTGLTPPRTNRRRASSRSGHDPSSPA
ncbi:LacI family DNA-binding transcriptional regulator [Acidisoma cellulosilytica]|uniref:LacI family DNA-binding transcriptional regulator n=1 Tax=Acidisoma cellulosilyticum TaxID=2802395 RepID=A0A963Z1G8_9PROT|nr:LacI family DNA-binding transcriptional regulator [Acidisoma cellulosilyticum]MCB8881122.1 LacI family DNA-binding transcriptional regulator [Acidisoma cellulosilyticum]